MYENPDEWDNFSSHLQSLKTVKIILDRLQTDKGINVSLSLLESYFGRCINSEYIES